jgi:hypothetical protein
MTSEVQMGLKEIEGFPGLFRDKYDGTVVNVRDADFMDRIARGFVYLYSDAHEIVELSEARSRANELCREFGVEEAFPK